MTFRPYHAVSVPKTVDLEEGFRHIEKPLTTAMLRNIPNRYTQASLLHEIEDEGFSGSFNFFYLPMDTHNRTNVGYAFINFKTPEDMSRFTKLFAGYNFKDHASQKIARVSPAHIQGFEENIRHFANRAVAHSRNSQYRPLVVHQGQQLDLTEAYDLLCKKGSAAAASPEPAEQHLDPAAAEFFPAMPASAFSIGAPDWMSALLPFINEQQWSMAMPMFVPSALTSASDLKDELADPESFTMAKKSFEDAVSKWIAEELHGGMALTSSVCETSSSTDGGSGVPSSSGTPRSPPGLSGYGRRHHVFHMDTDGDDNMGHESSMPGLDC